MRTGRETEHIDTAPALRADGVSFAYHPQVPVLESVSLTVPPASLTCIIGPNGGGKSTFLRLALGLLEFQQGALSVFGAPPHRACSRIGYVPQQLKVRPDFPIRVKDVVRMGGFGRRLSALSDATGRAISQAGLQGVENRSFSELSGGQRQRVLIARALVGEPGLLVLDEPASGIDPAFERQLRELLYRLKQTIAVVVVSHDLTFIGPQTDQVVFIDRTARVLSPDRIDLNLIGQLYHRPESAQ
ncbi:metal ABC transporter ATP-binding protein [Tichowtungia aerotolerans]|uniref:ATP-binding cassette domain-containing protein n=1 Tax=Tichowtungia aerotolerans TaxID=2697043 RepID=A0A6P1M5R6_9BACT|nr:ATP-binding cassette domain-containing protein [Tichowtungia aerotolerans]QHI68343.1 ATP-binding cassette domain-containing protein [Tichowtungia aerotolerans]